VAAALDDLADEQFRDPRGQRTAFRTRERAVEIAPIGKITRVVDHPVDVDDRDRDQRAAQMRDRRAAEQAANDLEPVEFVAVDHSGDEHARPVAAPVNHVHR